MKILIVKLSSMGDVLHALPAVAELKKQLGAEIHWAVQPEFAKLTGCFRCIDKVIPVQRHGGIKPLIPSIRSVRAEKYDMAVDLQGLFKSGLITWISRSKVRIGPSFQREGARIFYTSVAGKKNKLRHAVDECMDILDFLNLKRPEQPSFPISFPDESSLISDPSAPQIAIAPVSRWKTKNWPADKFAETAMRLIKGLSAEIHIIGGKGDFETAETIIGLASRTLNESQKKKLFNRCGKLSMTESGGLIAKSDVLVSNDSGPMHIAAALGVPCVVPFGPTIPERTGPYGSIHRIIRADNCFPCRSRTCAKGDIRCMTGISADTVFKAVADVLGKPKSAC